MSTTEAISKLRQMQAQIIHGSNIFEDIADCLEHTEKERACWQRVAEERGVEIDSLLSNELRPRS